MADPAADGRAVETQQLVLKRLLTVGSHGMLQKHLFQRMRPMNTSKLVGLMRELEEDGLITSSESTRHSQRRATLWNITPAGKAIHLVYVAEQAAKDQVIQDALLESQRAGSQP